MVYIKLLRSEKEATKDLSSVGYFKNKDGRVLKWDEEILNIWI